MPKRKRERHSDDNYDDLAKKIKKLQKKMKRARRERRRHRSPSSSSDNSKRARYDSPERCRSIAVVDDNCEDNNIYSPGHSSWYNLPDSEKDIPHQPVVQYVTADVHPPPTDEPRRPASVVTAVTRHHAAAAATAATAAAPAATPHVPTVINNCALEDTGAPILVDLTPPPPAPSSVELGTSELPLEHPPNVAVTSCPEPEANEIIELDSEVMEILGEDPTCTKDYGPDIQKDLAVRLSHIATSGLTKENRKELKDKYLIPGNCRLIKAPSLNPEIRASLIESQAKRDKGIENNQNMTSCALSSLSTAITILLSSENKNPELLKLLMDTARILGDIQHSDSILRRFFVLSTVKKDLKDQLEKTQIGELLFGSNLLETLKSAKIINKSGADIRSASTVKTSTETIMRTSGKPLNFRAPPARGRPSAAGAARSARPPQPPPAATQRRTTTRPTQYSAFRTSSRPQRQRR